MLSTIGEKPALCRYGHLIGGGEETLGFVFRQRKKYRHARKSLGNVMGVLGRADSEGIKKLNYQAWGHGMREIGVMAAHMHAEAMTVEQAPLSEKMKRRAACHLENRTQREQTNESMCECAMGEVRWANAVHVKLDQWTQAFLA